MQLEIIYYRNIIAQNILFPIPTNDILSTKLIFANFVITY